MNESAHNTLHAYGITLQRLRGEFIEQVRLWRNAPQVRRWMEFADEITPEMQAAWFSSLDPARQYYYLIETQSVQVGLVNLKNLDPERKSAEGGIFIADEAFQNGMLGLQATLAMYDFGFDVLGLHEITAHIRNDNPRAIRLNQAIGFKKDPGQDGVLNPEWRVAAETYRLCTGPLKTFLLDSKPTNA